MTSSSSISKPSLQLNQQPISNGINNRNNGSSSTPSIRIKLGKLKSLYSKSVNSFLYREFNQVRTLLEESYDILEEPGEGWSQGSHNTREWFDYIKRTKDEDESTEDGDVQALREQIRKLEILKITFLATAYGTTIFTPSNSTYPTISTLLRSSTSALLLSSLWLNALPTSSTESTASSIDIFPTPSAAFLHPSIIIALSLAALKLNQPRIARSITESYFGSISEEIELFLEGLVTEESLDLLEFPLFSGGNSSSSTQDLSLSTSTLDANGNVSRSVSRSVSISGGIGSDPKITLLSNYLKILDLLTLHVLPSLNEWEASEDFLRSQSIENGGWISDSRITLALEQLSSLHQNSIANSIAQLEREKAQATSLELARSIQVQQEKQAEKDRIKSTKIKSKSSSSVDKHSPGSSSEDNFFKSTNGLGSTTSSSPSKSKHSRTISSTAILPPAETTGFASLRSTLSSYLAQPLSITSTSNSTNLTSPSQTSFLRKLIHILKSNTITADPVKLLSLICFVVAFTSYIKKKRLTTFSRSPSRVGAIEGGGGFGVRRGLGKVLGLIKETARMGTKVTSL